MSICDLVIGRMWEVEAAGSCTELSPSTRLNNVVVDFESQETGRALNLVEARVAIDLQPLAGDRTSNDRL